MICPKCKTVISDNAKFCNRCGAKINVKLCPNGHVMEPGWVVCRYCPPAKDSGTTRVIGSTSVEKKTEIEKKTRVEKEVKPLIEKTVLYGKERSDEKEEKHTPVCWVVIVEGKNQWRDFRIKGSQSNIGRDPKSDIVIEDEHVSAVHASIRVKEDKVILTDLDSSNGTYVNGHEISRTELKDNDLIKVGDTVLKFKML